MNRTAILLTFLCLTSLSIAQGWNPVGARSNALSGASVTLSDAWSSFHNVGAAAKVKSPSFGVYYDARFLQKELQNQALAAVIPLKKGAFTFGTQLFGYEQYRHSRTGFGYALQLSDKFSAGIQTNLHYLRLNSNYGATLKATAEAGFKAEISEKWSLGFAVTNIGRQVVSETQDRLSTLMRFGVNYKPSKVVTVLFEVEKDVNYPIVFKGALEYKPIPQFVVRGGAQNGPNSFAFGAGYVHKGITVDLGSKYHPVLGWTPNIGFNYQILKNEE